jgi:hypothetical protein
MLLQINHFVLGSGRLAKHKMLPFVLTAAQTVRAKTVVTRMAITDRQTDRKHTNFPQSRVLIIVHIVKRMSGSHGFKRI